MSILLVHGGARHARAIFRDQGRGHWAAALPLVLEKHGVLDVEVADPTALTDGAAWESPGVNLIARLPEAAWTSELIDAVVSSRRPTIVEGPLAPALERKLGLTRAGSAGVTGRVVSRDRRLSALAAPYGGGAQGALSPPVARPVERRPEVEWSAIAGIPLTPAQARAWQAPGWEVTSWSDVSGARVLAGFEPAGSQAEGAAIVRSGSTVACSFGLFGVLGQAHTSEPFPPGVHLSSARTDGLEALLLGLLDELHADAGLTRVRVLPWPGGAAWVLNVRHDFDRALGARRVRELVLGHRRAGTAATWYWRARRIDEAGGRRALREVAGDPAHEVALHAERLWAGGLERQRVELAAGARIAGASAHGDPNSTRYQGAPNVLWAEREGLQYTELIQHGHHHPHRFAALSPGGEIHPLRVICLPHHESFDRSARGGDVGPDRLADLARTWAPRGGMAQVLSHPDINTEPLLAALRGVPRGGRLDWTAAQAVDWWQRTHVAGELYVERRGPAAFELTSARGVAGLSVELRDPSGECSIHRLDLPPGETVRLEPGSEGRFPAWAGLPLEAATVDAGAARARATWDRRLGGVAAERVRAWHEERGVDPLSAPARAAVRTHGELVPDRWQALRRAIDRIPGIRLADGSILDATAGFGALAVYAALATDARSVTACDGDPSRLEVGRAIAAAAGREATLRFVPGDLRALSPASFDLVIADLGLLRAPAGDGSALTELARVLRPGGGIVVHQATPLGLGGAFLPLAAPVLRAAGDRRGREHGPRSPKALRRELGRASFEEVSSGALGRRSVASGAARYAAAQAFAVGRRPVDEAASQRPPPRSTVRTVAARMSRSSRRFWRLM